MSHTIEMKVSVLSRLGRRLSIPNVRYLVNSSDNKYEVRAFFVGKKETQEINQATAASAPRSREIGMDFVEIQNERASVSP